MKIHTTRLSQVFRFLLTMAVLTSLVVLPSNIKPSPKLSDIVTNLSNGTDSKNKGIVTAPVITGADSALSDADKVNSAQVTDAYMKLPLSFEPNRGQVDSDVRFISRGSGYNLFLTQSGAVLKFQNDSRSGWTGKRGYLYNVVSEENVLWLKMVDSKPAPRIVELSPLSGKSNYFLGNNPNEWRGDVVNYGKVKYEDIYPGIDLLYYGNQRQLEYDFVLAPNANPDDIKVVFEGAETLSLDRKGELVLTVDGNEVRQHKPIAYQEVAGVRKEIPSRYTISDKQEVGFLLGEYDSSRPLIIDPVLRYSTYLGGSRSEEGNGIVVDSKGSAYIIGETLSSDFPATSGAFRSSGVNHTDVFVIKLDVSSSIAIYSTYLGGSGHDTGHALAVDSEGNVYVTGGTTSHNFPLENALQDTSLGFSDVFVTKLNKDGSGLIYSTYLSGSGGEAGTGIWVNDKGRAYITGTTESDDFPTANAIQPTRKGSLDVFLAALSPEGRKLNFATYLGGSGVDQAGHIAGDRESNIYLAGSTTSTDLFTTSNAFQTVFGGGALFGDAFVMMLIPKGTAISYSTYLGGGNEEIARGIAVDSSKNVYVTGITLSGDFPTTNGCFQPVSGDGGTLSDAFVTKLNTTGIVYSTYIGGSNQEEGMGIAVDSKGRAYITGRTNSSNFPITSKAIQHVKGGNGNIEDAFVTVLSSEGISAVYSSYLGGNFDDEGRAIAVDSAGNIYVVGMTDSSNFPTTQNAFQSSKGSGQVDAFFVKIKKIKVKL